MRDEAVSSDFNGEQDSHVARCDGLLNRIALKKSDNTRVFAQNIRKDDGPFYCPKCLSDAIVRKCTEKVDHFAHRARYSPIVKAKEKALHNKCRDEICAILQAEFKDGKWAAERTIPANESKGFLEIIPDISGRIGDTPIAVEVQTSAYTVNKLVKKILEYEKRKVAVIWIIPLKEELGDKEFRPRLFEKYLHSLYYGRVYYWLPNSGTLLQPVHFSPAKRWIEESTWYDVEYQAERTEGGYWLTYRTLKMPLPGKVVDLKSDFVKNSRPSFAPKNVKKSIPECTIFQDNLKEWWDKEEYKKVELQHAVFKEKNRSVFVEYDFHDEYDDYD